MDVTFWWIVSLVAPSKGGVHDVKAVDLVVEWNRANSDSVVEHSLSLGTINAIVHVKTARLHHHFVCSNRLRPENCLHLVHEVPSGSTLVDHLRLSR